MTATNLAADQYLNAKQVRERYSVSSSWILRKTRDMGFPQPASRFGGRSRYWLLSDLTAWEMTQIHANDARQYPLVVR
jgi:predicted DNA-binding transcriptional regulator AlpA